MTNYIQTSDTKTEQASIQVEPEPLIEQLAVSAIVAPLFTLISCIAVCSYLAGINKTTLVQVKNDKQKDWIHI